MKTTKNQHISRRLRRFARANEAVSALEYAILVGVIAVGIGAAMLVFEGQIEDAIAAIGGNVGTAANVQGATALNSATN